MNPSVFSQAGQGGKVRTKICEFARGGRPPLTVMGCWRAEEVYNVVQTVMGA